MRRTQLQRVLRARGGLLSLGLGLALSSVACSSDLSPSAPPPLSERPSCVISADCPAGAHCDLEECVQDCTVKDPCTGGLTCTPRARCVGQGEPDQDPKPEGKFLGDVRATPGLVALTDRHQEFQIQLAASSAEPVRYRVQLLGPHLGIDEARGEFTGTTTLSIRVDASKLKGRDVPGTVKIFTSLGNVVVDAPIHVGLTGAYGGALRYDGGPVNLGDGRIALELIERNGEIWTRVDSGGSLLFPETADGAATGHGSYTVSDGVDVTLSQRIDETFGDEQSPFRRPIGRRIRLKLKPTLGGDLEGTFEESIIGLFANPITVTGHVRLEHRARESAPQFELVKDPPMPQALPAPLGPDAVFGWKSTCEAAVECGGATPCKSPLTLANAEYKFARPLNQTILNSSNSQATTTPFPQIATSCRQSLAATTMTGFNATCGLMAPLACSLRFATQLTGDTTAHAKLASRLVAETLAPALLVAKDDVVTALSTSFVEGPAVERARYDAAMKALGPVVTWILQPDILEYLRSMPAEGAKGDGAAGTDFPAARALADALTTMAMIEGERARIAGVIGDAGDRGAVVAQAQRRAVLGYLHAVTLNELVRSWGNAPSSLAATYTGALGALDRGFAALLAGANVFGVPSEFVPFVFRPEDAGRAATNFEQMLSIATTSLGAEKLLEDRFLDNKRAYEANVEKLQSEISNVRLQFDVRLKDMCGAHFLPETLAAPDDMSSCGANNAGELGLLLLEIEAAKARIQSAESRMLGLKEKIGIDRRALAASQATHQQTISFITSTGQSLEALAFAEGTINAAQAAIQVASQASLLNAGAPLAEAAIQFALGEMKTAIEVQRTELQTAQSLQYERASAQREYIDGMAAIQKELVDLKQLHVDLDQELIGKLQADLRVQQLLAQARVLLEERGRVLAIASQGPANNPSFRLIRDRNALETLTARAEAQRQLYLSARALYYEHNMSIGAVDGAVLAAHDSTSLERLQACLLGIYNNSRIVYGTPQDYVTTVSVRKMLGISAPRTDAVTGQTLSEGEQFRQLLLKNENLDDRGGVGVFFSTNLQPGNELWSADVCADRLTTVQAQLVGDFLGDNQAQVNLSLQGDSVMRSCDGEALRTWSLGGADGYDRAVAVVQAGVNTFGDAPPNSSLFGQSVARASWRLVIPGGQDAPANADIDLTHVDDIVLKFSHKALPRKSTPLRVDFSCLSSSGR